MRRRILVPPLLIRRESVTSFPRPCRRRRMPLVSDVDDLVGLRPPRSFLRTKMMRRKRKRKSTFPRRLPRSPLRSPSLFPTRKRRKRTTRTLLLRSPSRRPLRSPSRSLLPFPMRKRKRTTRTLLLRSPSRRSLRSPSRSPSLFLMRKRRKRKRRTLLLRSPSRRLLRSPSRRLSRSLLPFPTRKRRKKRNALLVAEEARRSPRRLPRLSPTMISSTSLVLLPLSLLKNPIGTMLVLSRMLLRRVVMVLVLIVS